MGYGKQRLFSRGSSLQKQLDFFHENRSKLGKIRSINIYFHLQDVVIDGYYEVVKGEDGRQDHLEEATFVISDMEGNELWLSGCNCGYIGGGPGASASLLKSLRDEGTLSDTMFTDEYIKELLYDKIVKITFKDDRSMEMFHGGSLFPDVSEGSRIVVKSGKPIMIQDAGVYDKKTPDEVYRENKAYIPDPKKIMLIPSEEMSEELGYTYDLLGRRTAYNIIIQDASGREMWLRTDNKKFMNNADVDSILRNSGFTYNDEKGKREYESKGKLQKSLIFLSSLTKEDESRVLIFEH